MDPQAVAKLLFEALRSAGEQLHSQAAALWPLYLDTLVARPETEILYDVTKFLGEQSSAEHLAPLVRQMVARVAEEEEEGVRYLLRCLRILVLLKGGKLVQEPEALVRLLEETTVGSVEVVELACDMPGICLGYAWDMHVICLGYAWDMPVICLINARPSVMRSDFCESVSESVSESVTSPGSKDAIASKNTFLPTILCGNATLFHFLLS